MAKPKQARASNARSPKDQGRIHWLSGFVLDADFGCSSGEFVHGASSASSATTRSAVKARLFDPLRESFGEERCAPRRDGVMAFKRPSRGFRPFVMRRNPLESRADGGMRAYVISGGPLMTTRKPAPCVRAAASRHVVWRERREGLAQHAR
jgi:hypothetical protein